MKKALARHWCWFVLAAIPMDIAIATVPHITGDFADAMFIFPVRWLIMAGGVFATRWAQQAGAISQGTAGWVANYLIFGFTAAALLGGAFWRFQA
jgi:hypothetical protein